MNRNKEIIKTSAIGIIGNCLLVAAKAVVGIIATSVSIILDAVNNLTDAMSSVITIIGTKLSNKKPNKKHPYGFGRIEYITSSIIGMFIFAAGFIAVYEAIQSIISGETAEYNIYSFIVISIAIVAKIGIGLFFRYRGNKLTSDSLRASGTDALLDSILSLGTLVGALISFFWSVSLEGYIGILIGLFIIKTSIEVFKESISKIIGERSDASFITELTEDILNIPEVKGVYDLIINNYGNDKNIGSVHIEVADAMTAKEIQKIERQIAVLSYEKYSTIMTTGIYAQNEDDEISREIKSTLIKIVSEYKNIIQLHGFYYDKEHKIISADIIFSFDEPDEQKIYDEIKQKLSDKYPEYSIHLVLDRDFALSQ